MRPPSADVAAAPPPLPDFWTEETAADAQMPGSAFYEAPPREDEAEADAEVAAAEDPGPPERSGRPPVPTLPPAKERLRNFETRQIISPLALRKLKAAAAPSGEKCESPEPGERPMTPSTATGGHSARSGGYSARSTPLPWTPGTSRPGSAMSYNLPQRPLTPGSSYGSRPGSAALGVTRPSSGMPPRPGSRVAQVPEWHQLAPEVSAAAAAEAAEREMAEAEVHMEQRWLERRNRALVNRTIGDEQSNTVRSWAERRARVEEEITRNAETARFQSDFRKREYTMPEDALQDIDPSVPPPMVPPAESVADVTEAGLDGRGRPPSPRSPRVPATARAPPRRMATRIRPRSALAERRVHTDGAPRIDVSRAVGEEPVAQFHSVLNPGKKEPEQRRALNTRIAHLRQIHARMLDGVEDPIDQDSDDEEQVRAGTAPSNIFATAEGANWASLSAYTPGGAEAGGAARNSGGSAGGRARSGGARPQVPRRQDDSDVVAATCDWWYFKHGSEAATPGDAGLSLDEMRFQQMQEVEDVKRCFARRNCQFNTVTLEGALVMPRHSLKPGVPLFNAMPNLTENPFAKDRLAKKKKGRKNGRGKRRR